MSDYEKGAASVKIELRDGKIEVRHGEDDAILFRSLVKPGTWDSMWNAIREGRIRQRVSAV